MWRMLQQKGPEDFVLATGETHTVREFTEAAFKELDMELEWKGKGAKEQGLLKKGGRVVLEVDPNYYRPTEVELLIGDATKAKTKLGWVAKTKFKELAKMMVNADFERVKRKGY
jgi:GDPmannose 4,6-dehydratase